jgi:hypothetical protein
VAQTPQVFPEESQQYWPGPHGPAGGVHSLAVTPPVLPPPVELPPPLLVPPAVPPLVEPAPVLAPPVEVAWPVPPPELVAAPVEACPVEPPLVVACPVEPPVVELRPVELPALPVVGAGEVLPPLLTPPTVPLVAPALLVPLPPAWPTQTPATQ